MILVFLMLKTQLKLGLVCTRNFRPLYLFSDKSNWGFFSFDIIIYNAVYLNFASSSTVFFFLNPLTFF